MSFGKLTKQELSTELYKDLKVELATTPADVEISGRNLVNLLGRAGNAIYKQEWINQTGATHELSGDKFLVKKTGDDSYIYKSVDLEANKHYLFMAKCQSLNGGLSTTVGFDKQTSRISSPYCTLKTLTTGSFNVAMINELEDIDSVVEFEECRVYEISEEIHAKINIDEEYTGDKLAEKYPYVDDIKCVENPYVECKENLLEGHFVNGTFHDSTGEDFIDSTLGELEKRVSILRKIPIEKGAEYTFDTSSLCNSNKKLLYALFKDGNRVGELNVIELQDVNKVTFTNIGGDFLRFAVGNIDNSPISPSAVFHKITLTKGSTPKTYDECHNSRLMLETKLYDGEKITRDNSGRYIKNSEWDEHILDVNYVTGIYAGTGRVGFKEVNFKNLPFITLTGSLNSYMIAYNGELIPNKYGTSPIPNNSYSTGQDKIWLTLPNNLTGWGDSYTPTEEEIRAFFLGWKMFGDADASKNYETTSTSKGWVKLWCGIGTKHATAPTISGTHISTCPTVLNDQGYTPYRLIYKKETPTTEEIKTHGSLVIRDGVDVNVGSGLVLGDNVESFLANGKSYVGGANTKSNVSHRLSEVLKVFDVDGNVLPHINIGRDTAEGYIVGGNNQATYTTIVDNDLADYLIYRPDTVTSFPITITAPQSTQEILERTIEELSNTNEKLSAENRDLHNKIESLPQVSNPNILINGDFQVCQRGTSFVNASGNTYTTDRWMIGGNTGACSVDTYKINKGIKLKYTRKTANTTTFLRFGQWIENPEKYAGKEVTLSFKLKNASIVNHATDNSNLTVTLRCKDTGFSLMDSGIPQVAQTQLAGISQMIDGVYSATGVLPTNIQKLLVMVHMQLNDTTNANGVFELDLEWIKLEFGDKATPFAPRPYAEELAMCQRYYYTGVIVSQICSNSDGLYIPVRFPVPMRIIPTVAFAYGGVINNFTAGGINKTADNVIPWFNSSINGAIKVSSTKALATAGDITYMDFSADAEIY